MRVRYSYLPEQFKNTKSLWSDLKKFVETGDFTLGKPLLKFEKDFARLIGTKYAVGVNSGTDAIKLSLKTLNVGVGDEVITAANTFVATVGAITEIGAKPIFVDCDDTFCMNVDLVEAAITEKTKAIMPVHLAGYMTNMPELMKIAEKHDLPVVEDGCQAILADIGGKRSGSWGDAAGFSLHPLKNLNVWADSGVVVTNDDDLNHKLRLLRNHGLKSRDEVVLMGYNTRLDSVQAIVGNRLLPDLEPITDKRIANAAYLDEKLSQIPELRIPPRDPANKRVFHLYIVFAEERDALYDHCLENGIEVKVHYPIPLYQQEGLQQYGYKAGDFPVTDRHAREMITFPADQYLGPEHGDYIFETVESFYQARR